MITSKPPRSLWSSTSNGHPSYRYRLFAFSFRSYEDRPIYSEVQFPINCPINGISFSFLLLQRDIPLSLTYLFSIEGSTIHSVLQNLFKLRVIKSLIPFDFCLSLSCEQWSNHHAGFIFYRGTSHTSLLLSFFFAFHSLHCFNWPECKHFFYLCLYWPLVMTPSRRTMLAWSNCPRIPASLRNERLCFSEQPARSVFMATGNSRLLGSFKQPQHTSPNSPDEPSYIHKTSNNKIATILVNV